MVKYLFVLFLVLLSGCSCYGEFEHISSIPDGNPFNDRPETSTDLIWTGIRIEGNSWYVDGAIGYETSSEFEGNNPHGRIVIGKEIKKWP
jgi:hypothetical protein